MDQPAILIFDPVQTPCPRETCSGLFDLVRKTLPDHHIHRSRTIPLSLILPHKQPRIVFLRHTFQQNAVDPLSPFKELKFRTSIIGVVCAEQKADQNLNYQWLNGLDDFLCCPFDQFDLSLRIHRIFQPQEGTNIPSPSDHGPSNVLLDSLVGKSKLFRQAVEKIPLLARSDATVLIEGETGTGKELFARAIHYQGPRNNGPFIPINCGALPDHLFENELFGHTKGAFTDAALEQKGLVQEAEGGTLFLDEVDSLSQAAQIKLLRFLQDRQYRPLGSPKSLEANVRVLAATNRDVKCLVQKKLFREDLYYRINTLNLFLPPLKDRPKDIPPLAKYFLDRAVREVGRTTMWLSTRVLTHLAAYSWPGNARELEAVIRRAATFCTTQTLEPEDLDLPRDIQEPIRECCLRNAKRRAVEQFERTYLINLLTKHQGNVSQAAKAAGKERRSFQRLLRKYEIDREIFLGKTE